MNDKQVAVMMLLAHYLASRVLPPIGQMPPEPTYEGRLDYPDAIDAVSYERKLEIG